MYDSGKELLPNSVRPKPAHAGLLSTFTCNDIEENLAFLKGEPCFLFKLSEETLSYWMQERDGFEVCAEYYFVKFRDISKLLILMTLRQSGH